MKRNRSVRERLKQFKIYNANKHSSMDQVELNNLFRQMPVYETSGTFTDAVMRRIAEPKSVAAALQGAGSEQWVQVFHRRKQFIHFSVAGAATYIFISTGVLESIMTLNSVQFGVHLQMKVQHAIEYGIQFVNHIFN